MLIIWRGYGIAIFLVFILLGAFLHSVFGESLNVRLIICISALVTAGFSLGLMYYLNDLGKKAGVKRSDDLFFIPVKFWPAIMGVLALMTPLMSETKREVQARAKAAAALKAQEQAKLDQEQRDYMAAKRAAMSPAEGFLYDWKQAQWPEDQLTFNDTGELIAIAFKGINPQHVDLAKVAAMTTLERIDLSPLPYGANPPFQLSHLQALPRLREIVYGSRQLTAEDGVSIGQMPMLKHLDLSKALVIENTLMGIGASKSIESIDMTNAKYGNHPPALKSLSTIPTLKRLDLTGWKYPAEKMPQLASQFAGPVEIVGIGELTYYGPKHPKGDQTLALVPKVETPAPVPVPTLPADVAAFEADPAYIKPSASNVTKAGNISQVYYMGIAGFGDAQAQSLLKLTELKFANLQGTAITDNALAALSKHPSITSLELSQTQITDQGLSHLAKMTNLTSLNIGRTKVTDAGLKHLESMPNLKSIDVRECAVTPAAVRSFIASKANRNVSGFTPVLDPAITADPNWVTPSEVKFNNQYELTELALPHDSLKEGTLSLIAKFPTLTKLSMPGQSKLTDAAMASIVSLEKLEDLDISDSPIGDAGVKSLAKLPKLSKLNLSKTKITDASLASLAALKELKAVDVSRTQLTEAAVEKFRSSSASVKVDDFPLLSRNPSGLTPGSTPDFPDLKRPAPTSQELTKAEFRLRASLGSIRFAAIKNKNKFPSSLAAIPNLRNDDKTDQWGDTYLYFGAGKTYDAFDKSKTLLMATAKAHEGKRIVAYTNGDVEAIDEAAFAKLKR